MNGPAAKALSVFEGSLTAVKSKQTAKLWNIIGCTNHSAKHSLSQRWHTGEQVYFLGFGCGDSAFDRPFGRTSASIIIIRSLRLLPEQLGLRPSFCPPNIGSQVAADLLIFLGGGRPAAAAGFARSPWCRLSIDRLQSKPLGCPQTAVYSPSWRSHTPEYSRLRCMLVRLPKLWGTARLAPVRAWLKFSRFEAHF